MERYEMLEQIGEGSHGKVYKGRRIYTGQFVALKFVPLSRKSTQILVSLRQEVAILQRLDHENIISLIDYFETETHIVVVTEFAHSTVSAIMQEDKSFGEDTLRLVALQLARALAYLHKMKVMHRDMKPENVLVASPTTLRVPRSDGTSAEILAPRIALADFGLAHQLTPTTLMLTSLKGTPLYMAPEQLMGRYDTAADIWALGAVLFELAAGYPAFYADSLAELVRLVTDGAGGAENAISWPPTMSHACKSFLQSCLTRDPSARPRADALLRNPWLMTVGIGHAQDTAQG